MSKKPLRLLSVLMIVMSVFFLSADYSAARQSSSVPPPYVPTGFPQVVVVTGTNFEMGKQYGEQTALATVHNLAIMKSKLVDKYGSATVKQDMKVWDYYLRLYDPTYVDWLQGIQAGLQEKGYDVSYNDLILLMVYPSENWARPANRPYPPETGVQAKANSSSPSSGEYHSCNSFAATSSMTKDGYPMHGITQMVSPEAMDTVIFLAFPKDGPSWVSQPYSGRVNGNSAMNSAGLAWTLTAITQWGPNKDQQDSYWGVVTEVYFHYFAQLAKTPEQAIKFLKKTPRAGVTGGVTLSDNSGNIQTFESNHDVWTLRTPGFMNEPGNFIVMTNHLVDPAHSAYNPPWAGNSISRYTSVWNYLAPVAGQGKIDFDFAKKLFEANYSLQGSVNQSIYQPATLTAYLQTGTPTGNGLPVFATGEYVKIRLATDPKTVTYNAGNDAATFYWAAVNAFQSAINTKAAWLTEPVYDDVAAQLDQAFTAYEEGMDRAAYADLQKKKKQTPDLWAEALTYYAKAQLYAQMASTTMRRAQGL